MLPIKRMNGIISQVRELTPTAREYVITPTEPFTFTAGAFVNLFVTHEGQTIRRAFSMSSDDTATDQFAVSIRLSKGGALTPLLWSHDFTNTEVSLMGPLGLNTADKMQSKKIFLFGFGIGAGVVKSLAMHHVASDMCDELVIVTGNRAENEIIHKDFFDELQQANPKVSCQYVVSQPTSELYPIGYIQDHIDQYDFNDSDVYICGQTVACKALQEKVMATNPSNCTFFVEDFH